MLVVSGYRVCSLIGPMIRLIRSCFLKLSVINKPVIWFWAVSSVGRASRLHRGGQRFESFTAHQSK